MTFLRPATSTIPSALRMASAAAPSVELASGLEAGMKSAWRAGGVEEAARWTAAFVQKTLARGANRAELAAALKVAVNAAGGDAGKFILEAALKKLGRYAIPGIGALLSLMDAAAAIDSGAAGGGNVIETERRIDVQRALLEAMRGDTRKLLVLMSGEGGPGALLGLARSTVMRRESSSKDAFMQAMRDVGILANGGVQEARQVLRVLADGPDPALAQAARAALGEPRPKRGVGTTTAGTSDLPAENVSQGASGADAAAVEPARARQLQRVTVDAQVSFVHALDPRLREYHERMNALRARFSALIDSGREPPEFRATYREAARSFETVVDRARRRATLEGMKAVFAAEPRLKTVRDGGTGPTFDRARLGVQVAEVDRQLGRAAQDFTKAVGRLQEQLDSSARAASGTSTPAEPVSVMPAGRKKPVSPSETSTEASAAGHAGGQAVERPSTSTPGSLHGSEQPLLPGSWRTELQALVDEMDAFAARGKGKGGKDEELAAVVRLARQVLRDPAAAEAFGRALKSLGSTLKSDIDRMTAAGESAPEGSAGGPPWNVRGVDQPVAREAPSVAGASGAGGPPPDPQDPKKPKRPRGPRPELAKLSVAQAVRMTVRMILLEGLAVVGASAANGSAVLSDGRDELNYHRLPGAEYRHGSMTASDSSHLAALTVFAFGPNSTWDSTEGPLNHQRVPTPFGRDTIPSVFRTDDLKSGRGKTVVSPLNGSSALLVGAAMRVGSPEWLSVGGTVGARLASVRDNPGRLDIFDDGVQSGLSATFAPLQLNETTQISLGPLRFVNVVVLPMRRVVNGGDARDLPVPADKLPGVLPAGRTAPSLVYPSTQASKFQMPVAEVGPGKTFTSKLAYLTTNPSWPFKRRDGLYGFINGSMEALSRLGDSLRPDPFVLEGDKVGGAIKMRLYELGIIEEEPFFVPRLPERRQPNRQRF